MNGKVIIPLHLPPEALRHLRLYLYRLRLRNPPDHVLPFLVKLAFHLEDPGFLVHVRNIVYGSMQERGIQSDHLESILDVSDPDDTASSERGDP